LAKKKNRSKGGRIAKRSKAQSVEGRKETVPIAKRLEELNQAASMAFNTMERDMTSIFKSSHAKEIGDLHNVLEETKRLIKSG
jgi:hypothetical protein